MRYLTATEAALVVGVSHRTIRRYCEAGRIPGVKRLGRNRLAIPEESVLPLRRSKPDLATQLAEAQAQIARLERENAALLLQLAAPPRPALAPLPMSATITASRPERVSNDLPAAGSAVAGITIYHYDGALSKGTAGKIAAAHGANGKKDWKWPDGTLCSLRSILATVKDNMERYPDRDGRYTWHECDDWEKCLCHDLN